MQQGGTSSAQTQRSCAEITDTRTNANSARPLNLGEAAEHRIKTTAPSPLSPPPPLPSSAMPDSSFVITCKGSIKHERLGSQDCQKLVDTNGNTGVAFRKPKTHLEHLPEVELEFTEAQPAFKLLWIYRHPKIHKHRQLEHISVYCRKEGKAVKVASINLRQNLNSTLNDKNGWVALKLQKRCPFKSKLWEFKDMQSRGRGVKTFFVFDLLLGYNSNEEQLLPKPTTNKVNGFCVHQQSVPLGEMWQAMSWDPARWQRLVTFQPDVFRIPPSSTVAAQLMFDETRVDWAGSRLPENRLPTCRASLVAGCTGLLQVGSTFSLMDETFTGLTASKVSQALHQSNGFEVPSPYTHLTSTWFSMHSFGI